MGNTASGDFIHAVSRIRAQSVDPDADLWELFFDKPSSVTQVFALIQPTDVRKLRRYQPRNLSTLLRRAVLKLHTASEDFDASRDKARVLNCARLLTRILPTLFEDASDGFCDAIFWRNQVPLQAGEDAGGEAAEEDELPIAEAHAAIAAQKEDAPLPEVDWAYQPVFVPMEEEEEAEVAGTAAEAAGVDEPLGRVLVHAVMRLLFAPDLTVARAQFRFFLQKLDETAALADEQAEAQSAQVRAQGEAGEGEGEEQGHSSSPAGADGGAAAAGDGGPQPTDMEEGDRATAAEPPRAAEAGLEADADAGGDRPMVPDETNSIWPTLLWHGGLGFPDAAPPQSAALDAAREEMLRLLLALMSETLYRPPNVGSPARCAFMDELVRHDCPLTPTLLFSLVSTSLNYDPVGMGIPYTGLMSSELQEKVASLSIQVLTLLVDYGGDVPSSQQAQHGEEEAAEAAAEEQEPPENVYRVMLSSLSSPSDFAYVLKGITKQLSTLMQRDAAMLPGSVKSTPFHQEVLVFLWKALSCNPLFLKHTLADEALPDLVSSLLFLMWQNRLNAARVGLIHLCTFTLLLLSGQRDFGVALNASLEVLPPMAGIPAGLEASSCNHLDLLVVVLQKLVVNGDKRLRTLYSCIVTIIANIAPYAKSLSLVSAVKLLSLFKIFSSPKVLLRHPEAPSYVAMLIEAFDSIVQYQYDGNTHVVYAIVREAAAFKALTQLSTDDIPRRQANPADGAAAVAEAARAEDPDAAAQDGAEGDGAAAAPVTTGQQSGVAAGTAAQPAQAGEGPAAAPSGSNEWRPSAEWLSEWKASLPLQPLLTVVEFLHPRIVRFVEAEEGSADEEAIMEFVEATTLVGLLPRPHPIMMRRYSATRFTNLWFTTFLWGVIYLRNLELPIFDSDKIRLFSLATA